MAKSITKRTLIGFRKAKVNTRYFEDLINQIKNKPENFVAKVAKGSSYWKAINNDNMKFNAIVGNPPYQVMDGGAGASAIPIYNKFFEIGKKVTPSYISMIMPSRWMTGGRGLDQFRSDMIADKRISVLYDHINSKDCFEQVEIKGGICYLLWDENNNAPCEVYSISAEETIHSTRYLAEPGEDIFIRDSRLISIKNKMAAYSEDSFESIVSSMKPYGLRGDFFKSPQKYGLPDISKEKIIGGYTIYGLDERMQRTLRYIPKEYPLPKSDMLNDYKIFVTRNYGNGLMGELPSSPIFAKPGDLCTETFVQIGPFGSLEEAKNCYSYFKTKLFRLLVGIIKHDQGAGKNVYRYVPIQDFSETWTDEQLYTKYNLSEDEVGFIEKMIKPM